MPGRQDGSRDWPNLTADALKPRPSLQLGWAQGGAGGVRPMETSTAVDTYATAECTNPPNPRNRSPNVTRDVQ